MVDEASGTNGHWERKAIQTVLLEHLKEQRRARRWGIFFKLVMIVLIGIFIYESFRKDLPQKALSVQNHTALIKIEGEIGPELKASADKIREALKKVYKNPHVKGVILRINSPGGTPVQARQIYDDIQMYRKKYPQIKVYAAIDDLGTSGAYLIASAADSIYADETSLVGSIGVMLSSFGFVDGMHKMGIERRLYKAGKHKGFLDPFSPRTPEDEAFVNEQLQIVHQAFIKNVREGRGARLKDSPEIFSGLFWCGAEALPLGLIDGFGDAQYVARELIKVENTVDYTPSENFLDKWTNKMGASLKQGLLFLMSLA